MKIKEKFLMKKQILDENISHKLSMESKDIVNDNVAKLMELFPNCVLEQKDPVGGGQNAV